MSGFWDRLGLTPTYDISVIKRAYAQKARICHPEEDPEGFLELREAYQAALDYVEQEGVFSQEPVLERNQLKADPEGRELDGERADEREPDKEGWHISEDLPEAGENPFCDGEAIGKFVELYTGKQRNNAKLWMDYFTSGTFLDAGWDSRFTALMLEMVTEMEQDFPPSKEFLMWLGIAYQFSVKEARGNQQPPLQGVQVEKQVELHSEADFEGMEAILCIAVKGPLPRRLGGDELAIRESFMDYRHLTRLADSGSWNDQAMEEFKWIIGRYSTAYIKERCDPKANPDYQRHIGGLRVFLHFFRRGDLPEEIYRIVWRKFDLKNAGMGRMKILYGSLRELVVERVPGIEGEESENILKLSRDRKACFSYIQEHPEQEEGELEVYFAREDFQKALRSRRFVEEQLLSYSEWLNPSTPEGAVRRLAEFYRENQDIPGWDRVVERAEQELEEREKERKRKEEEAAEIVPEELDFSLFLALPTRVYVQPLTEPERVFRLEKSKEVNFHIVEFESAKTDKGCKFEADSEEDGWKELLTDDDWEASGDGTEWEYRENEELLAALGKNEEADDAELLTEEGLSALFCRFADGELTRLELEFQGVTLALVRDKDKYACFCFEESNDTWYSMLSQPEVYQTVDYKKVVYLPFGMGELAAYSIHETPLSILRNLNLAFMQIGRGYIQVKAGNCWLWSSHTSQQNSRFKKVMAMQKLAQIPVRYSDNYILAKFVFSQYPDWVETVALSGERTLDQLKPGSYDLAAAALTRFFQQGLAKLRLSWEPKGKKAGTGLRHIVLLQDSGQFMMAWLQDGKEQASFYASDSPRIFLGHVYPACLVHQDLRRIRNCLDWMLDDMSCVELVTDRLGEFVLAECPYVQMRAELVDERM